MPPPGDLAADVPKTDRELLLNIYGDMTRVCALVDRHEKRISVLENWRWYILGGISICTLILVTYGRLIDVHIVAP
jgi:hypothetical protein